MIPSGVREPADVVRMYLRESGRVPLLTRDGEVKVARRIERGEIDTLKALSRSAMAVEEMCRLRVELAAGRDPFKRLWFPVGTNGPMSERQDADVKS